MFDKRHAQIVVALCTAGAMIAFAVYQRYRVVTVPAVAFYGAAAIISLMPVLYRVFHCKTHRSKSPAS